MSKVATDPLIAMRGAGYYSDNTVGAKNVIDAVGDLALATIAGMDLAAPGPFAIADFGAADGGTSLDLMKRIVAAVRAASPTKTISLTYTDLPHNDFSVLFRRLQGQLGNDPAPFTGVDDLFTFASGTGFHRQIFPAGTLSFGFSATAMHWLSARPGTIADHVHAVGATVEERVPYREQARADWEAILLARARELKPGGTLVFANFCVDEQGRYLGGTGGVDMFDTFAKHWRALAAAGAITTAGISGRNAAAVLPHGGRVHGAVRGSGVARAAGWPAARSRLHPHDRMSLSGGVPAPWRRPRPSRAPISRRCAPGPKARS